MSHQFTAVLQKLAGKIPWTVIFIPFNVEEVYHTKGRVKVKATIDEKEFKTTLLPSSNGHYLVCNQSIRAALNKQLGDRVSVELELDTSYREVEIPREVAAALQADKEVMDEFALLPDYLKREEIQKITSAKKAETKERRLAKLVALLTKKNSERREANSSDN